MKKILMILIFGLFLINSVYATVGGLSEAKIQSNYFGFDKAWIVDFVSDDFTTDRINAYFTPSDFEGTSGTKTKQSLTISAQTKPTSCEWSLKEDFSTNPDVYLYTPYTSGEVWTTNIYEKRDELAKQCANLPGLDYYWWSRHINGVGKVNIWCVKPQKKLGTVGEFVNKFIVAETDWSVTASGKSPQTATISNNDIGDGRSSKLGDRVWVQWQGLAGTGEDCPITQGAIPIHSNDFSGGWRVSYQGSYDSYKNYLSTLINDVGRWKDGVISESTLANLLSTKSNSAISQNLGFGSFSVLSSSVSSGKIKIDLGRQIVFPQFRLIIDADYLELDIPTGEPKIVSVSDIEFTEGSSGRLSVTIKNIGSGEGGFNTRIIDCSNGFSSNTPTQGSRLTSQEQTTLIFEIIGSSTGEKASVSGSCSVEMKESITQEIDKKTFSITMNQIRECPPPDVACGVENNLHVIKKCNTEGTGLETIETCESDEICKETILGPRCKKEDDDDGDDELCPPILGFIPNIFCKISNFFKRLTAGVVDILEILRMSLIPITLIFTTLFSFNFFKRNRLFEIKKAGINFLVSLILGGIASYIVYSLLTTGVIFAIIAMVIAIGLFIVLNWVYRKVK